MEDRDKPKFPAVERRPAFSALENNLNCSTLDKSFTAELGLSATFMNLHWFITHLKHFHLLLFHTACQNVRKL